MLYKVLNTDSLRWSDVQASNVSTFLAKYKLKLRERHVHERIKLLKSYKLKGFPKETSVPLLLGLCKLEVEDSDELKDTIEALEEALRKYF